MREEDSENSVSEYADSLTTYSDLSEGLSKQYPGNTHELNSLFELATSIKEVLVPVTAPAFKASLRERIRGRIRSRKANEPFTSRHTMLWMAFAAAGSLLSIAGIAVLILRKLKTASEARMSASPAPL